MPYRLDQRPWRQRPAEDAFAWQPPSPGQPAATITVATWQRRIGAWQQHLDSLANPDRTWLLFEPDPIEFSAAMVAIWERGDQLVLPADNQPATLASLAASGVALGSLGSQPAPGSGTSPTWGTAPLPSVAVSLYTSGSTGDPQRLDKRFDQLDAELEAQVRLWPLEQRRVISQVSHQHIYGLLFAILRPLCESSPFATQSCRYPETLYAWLEQCREDECGVALISAPPALSRLPEALSWVAVREAVTRIHSSGAPLSRNASDAVFDSFATPVHEVYGSSETGGIAWRTQQQGDAWTPFPAVEVDTDAEQRLWLRSPHLAERASWQRQADRIETIGSGFHLLGRADRIVKIGGKRLSLTAMDQALGALPSVERALTLPLARRELRLAAVVQLAPEALPHDHASHRAMVKHLRQALGARFETPVLPRYWRFVASWPTNTQGKLDVDIRQRLFQDLDDRRAPRWLGEQPTATGWCVSLEVPEHCLYLDGHFDSQPVLPGVTLVHWAMQQASRLFALPGGFGGLERLRFPLPLLPGDRFTLTLALRDDGERATLHVQCDSPRGQHASGRLPLRREVTDVDG
ncbi:AMP-binding protein [Salinicola avicenniae]|uniref:AMP-binding protein n=1 Tax=Salinicola avicenniae TaxID=2916836 RepID=UPI0020731C3B|nr:MULTISPECIES: AMP-binding protein [unclassified Salinicola]